MSEPTSDPRRAELASRLLVLVLAGIFLLGLLGFFVAALGAPEEDASPDPTSLGTADRSLEGPYPASRVLLALAQATDVPAASEPSQPPFGATVAASPGPTVTSGPGGAAELLEQLVPVAVVDDFWSRRTALGADEAVAALRDGRLEGYRRVIVEESIREALAETLGIAIHAKVEGGDADEVAEAVARGALGFVAATDLAPRLKALDLDGRSLVGIDRIGGLERWPLVVTLLRPAGSAWDPGRTWVLVAGGDSFTDRGVHDQVVKRGRGVDFPFDGGTARVTGHACCDPVFDDNVVPRYVLTGGKGAVRRLFKSADLAILNHEQPVTDGWAFHRSGLRFSGRPDLTRIFVRAGIDWVSLANNHINDYGADGVKDSRRILRRYGLGFGGAGRDLEQARRISYLEAGGTRLAIVPCVGVVRFSWAGPNDSGGTPCLDRYIVPDIKKAKRTADVVVVFPHWGVEYTRQPQPSMRKHAARWVKAGADLVLGAHSHVAGAMEDIEGVPVLYSLGNLVFDQHWSTNTMESALVEATFHGPALVQLRLHPYIIHAQSQPNLLDPARGEGRRLLREVRAASRGWLDW